MRGVSPRDLSLIAAVCALTLSACSGVRPWERGALSLPSMDPGSASRALKEEFVRHTFDVREGASGGFAQAGGGCGCN